jgi:hypothetical protein
MERTHLGGFFLDSRTVFFRLFDNQYLLDPINILTIEEKAMKVSLIEEHIDQIKEIILECDQYKRKHLKQRSYAVWRDWAIKAAEQVNANEFEIKGTKNTFNWLVDQIEHCPPVAATPLGQAVLDWLPIAGQGPWTYLSYNQRQGLKKLFD